VKFDEDGAVTALLLALRAEGLTQTQIALHLNEHKVASPRGRRWYQCTVQRALKALGAPKVKLRDVYRPSGPPSRAQVSARERAWHIRRLRGLWYQVDVLTPARRRLAQQVIDDDLEAIGAEPQTQRHARERAEAEFIRARDQSAPATCKQETPS